MEEKKIYLTLVSREMSLFTFLFSDDATGAARCRTLFPLEEPKILRNL